jgi:hypothetical protein
MKCSFKARAVPARLFWRSSFSRARISASLNPPRRNSNTARSTRGHAAQQPRRQLPVVLFVNSAICVRVPLLLIRNCRSGSADRLSSSSLETRQLPAIFG